jgi:adenine C2-methylase RlmN of 23S rRNA A2503 and tRNA A37
MQNVFMVMSDIDQSIHDPAANNLREFAYMGQGEPGFSYTQLRQAIRVTDQAMYLLNQKVYRHILATSGVVEMVDALIFDLQNNFFGETRVTFHYSLHATQRRTDVMPINELYDFKDIIRRLPILQNLTGEKPCVGVLIFKDYCNKNNPQHYYTNEDEIERMANLLNPEICRISLCEFNPCDNIGTNSVVSHDEASRLVKKLEIKGFEVKLFASFGKQENTACGLLGGTMPDQPADETILSRYSKASSIIETIHN